VPNCAGKRLCLSNPKPCNAGAHMDVLPGAGRTLSRRKLPLVGVALLCGCHHDEEAEVTPGEDLMQEHGVLERVLLIYEEGARRMNAGEPLDLAVIAGAADIIAKFVEQYHERNEETFVFPRLEAAGREAPLVATLRLQHQRGRAITQQIKTLCQGPASSDLTRALTVFGRMYRPHAAREDTVLFPAFRHVIGNSAYRDLGEELEEQEEKLVGKGGFERTVVEVSALEKRFGIDELSRFTP